VAGPASAAARRAQAAARAAAEAETTAGMMEAVAKAAAARAAVVTEARPSPAAAWPSRRGAETCRRSEERGGQGAARPRPAPGRSPRRRGRFVGGVEGKAGVAKEVDGLLEGVGNELHLVVLARLVGRVELGEPFVLLVSIARTRSVSTRAARAAAPRVAAAARSRGRPARRVNPASATCRVNPRRARRPRRAVALWPPPRRAAAPGARRRAGAWRLYEQWPPGRARRRPGETARRRPRRGAPSRRGRRSSAC